MKYTLNVIQNTVIFAFYILIRRNIKSNIVKNIIPNIGVQNAMTYLEIWTNIIITTTLETLINSRELNVITLRNYWIDSYS